MSACFRLWAHPKCLLLFLFNVPKQVLRPMRFFGLPFVGYFFLCRKLGLLSVFLIRNAKCSVSGQNLPQSKANAVSPPWMLPCVSASTVSHEALVEELCGVLPHLLLCHGACACLPCLSPRFRWQETYGSKAAHLQPPHVQPTSLTAPEFPEAPDPLLRF